MGERQKAQLRAKVLKKGLDPEALTGKYPPKIRMYSKYERRTDTRSYDDGKKLYELNILKLPGRRSTMNGARDHPRSFPSGSVRDPARRRESLRLLRERREKRLPQLRRRNMMKRRKKRSMMRRKSKQTIYF